MFRFEIEKSRLLTIFFVYLLALLVSLAAADGDGLSRQAANVPAMSLEVDISQYFAIHHTPADTVDKISPMDISRCVAAMAVMGYVVADLPQRLGR